ncbi:MAG: hypothetical protein QOE60_2236 [Thermoleophilaceae bacterium]|nr:hypothetical protein [Thermoleophilaceae bacterium]
MPPRRSLPRPAPRWVALGTVLLAGGAAVVLLLTRDAPPPPPAPVPAARAELRLARQLGVGRLAGPAGSVSCPGSIREGHATRCQFRYPDGDTQLMLVILTRAGELDIDVPYPAQRRAGD